MISPFPSSRLLLALSLACTATLALGGCGPEEHLDAENLQAALPSSPAPRRDMRIAVVGAGASGITAALTLKDQGYTRVTVFEKELRVGGKVSSLRLGSYGAELGAVFASADYKLVLELADRFKVPYAPYTGPRYILDEQGKKVSFQQFLQNRYSNAEIAQAVQSYARTLQTFAQIDQDGFTDLAPDLFMTFDKFAAKHGFTPVAELARSLMVGFGYSYYETTPAAYFMKLLPWLVKIGPTGLESPPYFVFPTGFQSLWQAAAAELDVKLASAVTRIERSQRGGPVRLTINGLIRRDFDAVVLSLPLDVVPRLMTMERSERDLLARVETSRYFVTLFAAAHLQQGETVFIHDHGRPNRLNQAAAWGNPGGDVPIFIAYQIAGADQNGLQLLGTLASNVHTLGKGVLLSPLLQKEWTYFPRVNTASMQAGFYDQVDDMQGKGGVYFVGSSLSFETVEHTTRFARTLIRRHFPGPQ